MAICHFIFSQYRAFLEQCEGAKEAFTYVASHTERVGGTLFVIWPTTGSWIRLAVIRVGSIATAGRCVDPTTSDSEESESLITEEEATR